MASGFVVSKFAKIIFKMTVKGTQRNIPTIPKILPQKTKDNNITRDIKAARNISSLTADTVVLNMALDDITYNFDSSNKIITRQLGAGSPVTINTNEVEILGSFSNQSYLSRAKNIDIYLEIIYKNPGNLPDYNASTTINFGAELRGRR